MIAAIEAEGRVVRQVLGDGALTTEALYECRLESRLSGLPLVEVLLRRDVISDERVAQIYAEMYDLRYLDLARRHVSEVWVQALPENVARRKRCLPFGEVSGELVVAVADPADPSVAPAVQSRFSRPVQFIVSPRYQIREVQDRIYGEARAKGARFSETPASAALSSAATVSATGLNMAEELDSIIDEAVDRRASDIHIEPEQERLRVRYRIDGRLIESRAYPIEGTAAMISRIKVLSTLDITERRKPQDGRFSRRSFDQDIDLRVAVIPTSNGERVTMRILAMDRTQLSLTDLGMEIETRQAFERLIHRPYGIILLTGPTGSGKTTTLYAALKEINTIDKHIITIEDPVEYNIGGVNQVQVNPEHGVTFASALRSIVRHDPDVIMVGEVRDSETAHLALEASLTGHLVFSTLHTNSAVGAVTRLLDMGSEAYLVASSIVAVLAQRLVRRVCSHCKDPFEPNERERQLLELPPERTEVQVYRARGCARCLRSGYYDRVGLYEFVPFERELSELVMRKATTAELQDLAIQLGAHTLRMDGVRKVLHGLTTLEEVLRVTTSEED